MSDLSFIACILFANVNFTHVKNTRHWKSALMGLHMRTIGIILVPKAAILVVSATDRLPWPDQKIWGREWYYMKLGWCCVVRMT